LTHLRGQDVELRRRRSEYNSRRWVLDLIDVERPVASVAADLGVSDQTVYTRRILLRAIQP
jgi:hypothetical protein